MTTWYYAREGQQFGPHTEEELKALLAAGKLASHELVWKAGMPSWAPANTVFAPPPPPAGGPPPVPPAPAGGWAQQPALGPGPQPAGPQQGQPPFGQPQYGQPHHGQPQYAPQYAQQYGGEPPKERVAYVLLGIFLGTFGVHNFYAGYVSKAVAQLLITIFLWWLLFIPVLAVWIWNIIEVITVTHDAKGVPFR